MPTLTITRGLPGAGKTTWALAQVKASGGRVKRVNRDTLREMADAGAWSKDREGKIIDMEIILARRFLDLGLDVIVDDTNLPQRTVDLWRGFALGEMLGVDFRIQDFTAVPLAECLERNARRAPNVPEKVIRRMWRDYLQPAIPVPVPVAGRLWAVLCDVDGTLAHMTGRSPYEWDRVGEDMLDPVVGDLVLRYATDHEIIVVSGRDAGCRDVTREWLLQKGIPYRLLLMRPAGDTRPDHVVKRELYDQHIANEYNVRFVIDDRDSVVQLWRSLGLKVLQPAYGDF